MNKCVVIYKQGGPWERDQSCDGGRDLSGDHCQGSGFSWFLIDLDFAKGRLLVSFIAFVLPLSECAAQGFRSLFAAFCNWSLMD